MSRQDIQIRLCVMCGKLQRVAGAASYGDIYMLILMYVSALALAAFLSLSNGNKSRLGLRAILVADIRKFGSSYWMQRVLRP